MSRVFAYLIFALPLIFAFVVKETKKEKAVRSENKEFVLLELFTSQGCSSCPSADRFLEKTITDAQKTGKRVYALAFHVNYWN